MIDDKLEKTAWTDDMFATKFSTHFPALKINPQYTGGNKYRSEE